MGEGRGDTESSERESLFVISYISSSDAESGREDKENLKTKKCKQDMKLRFGKIN